MRKTPFQNKQHNDRLTFSSIVRTPHYLAASLLLVCCLFATILSPSTSAASPNDVIINEIQYNPNTGNQNDEFLELYNTTASPIDLGGWRFSAGITLNTTTFTAGTIIPAHGYLVVSPNIAQTMTTYGVVSSAEYAPTNLSNGGEVVTLVDDSSNVISSVNYDDVAPWPTSPDGSGPSLELKGTGLDNTIPTNWGASTTNGGTPLAVNSQVGLNLPTIASVTDPNNITASQAVDITATVTGTGITSITLSYKLNFDPDVSLTMYDDGAHNDGAAGDNVYGAQIPGQAEKTLVRFKVEATNASGTQASPSIDDSMDYHGYYIKEAALSASVPVIEWFIADADYADMHANHVYDNVYLPCVVVLDNEVYDNALVRIKGEYSLSFPKKGYKIKLPAGYTIALAGGSGRAIKEFHLNSGQSSEGIAGPVIAWHAAEVAGLKVPDILPARINKNGAFEGLYIYADKYEDAWRQEYGYTNGALYEDIQEVVFGASDLTDVNNWVESLRADRNDNGRREVVLDSINIPAVFNYMSTMALANSHDHHLGNNTFSYKSGTTGRWEHFIWDMDLVLQESNKMISPFDGPSYVWWQDELSIIAIYEEKDLRQMYYRHLRTVVDKLYANDELLTLFRDTNSAHAAEIALDNAKWPSGVDLYRGQMIRDERTLQRQKYSLLAHHRQPWAIPPAQTDTERQSVSFAEVVPNATDSDEYIRLYNTANTPVDLSDWVIEGINYTIPAGAVIPANGSLYILRDDIGYRAGHAAVLVAGQYSNDLGSNGTLTLKTDTGATIDTENY